MKIALADLSYLSKDDHALPVPLNVGYIAAYLRQEVAGVKADLFKDPQRLYETLLRAPDAYDLVALSNYTWNFNLNRHFMELIRRKNPDVITVMGGPNIDAGSDEGIREVFDSFPGLDFYVIGEGEYKFARLVKSLAENGMGAARVWEEIPGSVVSVGGRERSILRGRGAEAGDCDCARLPSPYLSGILDEFLEDPNLVPIIETSRGCPYSCAFCCWGSSTNSRVRPFETGTVVEELRYISVKSRNPMKALYIADSNFGILKRDVEIARALREMHARDGSHGNVCIYFAKKTSEDVVKIAELLREVTDVTMSKQTLNPEVLAIIGRINIPDGEYDRFYARLRQIGVSTYCELIYGLPGESLESFLDGLEKMYREKIRISLYPLLLFKGTRVGSGEFRDRYAIRSAFRVMPRYFGTYGDIHSVEYEEVLVSHAKLPEEDFRKIRLVLFFHYLFSETIFAELVHFLRGNDLNVASFLRFLVDDRVNWPASFEELVGSLEKALREELIEKEDLKHEFTDEEMRAIREKPLDLNVFHFCKLISSMERVDCFRTYLSGALRRYYVSHGLSGDPDEIRDILEVCFDKVPDFSHLEKRKSAHYRYDLGTWLASEERSLASCRTDRKLEYVLELDEARIALFEEHYNQSKDRELSLYVTRMAFRTSDPSRVYTYRRTLIG
jgi:radical SAM superfamily enzyme YgiQ (UPF0313 family)